jgi:acetyl esterase
MDQLAPAEGSRHSVKPPNGALIRWTDSVWGLRAASTSDGLQGYHRAMAPRLADDELTAFLDDFNARPTAQATALVLYLHGGGFVFGDLETHDRACRRLADRSGVPVLALDYRRAPEHPWPAAVDDAVAAVRWIASQPPELQIAPAAVAIAGDSAGGTIAALACVRLRDEAPEMLPRAQLLVYANTDLSNSGASMREKGHGFGLDVADIEWFNSQWVPEPAMLTDPRVSPLFAPDLTGLPTAFVITAEHDPLRDQGEAYAGHLREAGVTTTVRREQGMVHNFMLWDTISPACAAAADRVAADLAASLRQQDS